MQEREINFIGENLYQETLKDKRSGEWTKHDLKLEAALYKELTKAGFRLDDGTKFYWHMQLGPACFTAKDKSIVPIFTKYIGQFDDEGLNDHFMFCMAVPGLYEATEFYLDQWKKYCGTSNLVRNTIANSLFRIRDPHHISDYMNIINDHDSLKNETVLNETGLIIELLGKVKAKVAIPRLIELLDRYTAPCIHALGCFRDPEHIKYVARFLDSPNSYIRQCAAEAIKRMGGELEKVRGPRRSVYWNLIDKEGYL